MPNNSITTKRDLLNRYADLKLRIRNLIDGVTPMHFYIGAYGLNTFWVELKPGAGWRLTPGSHIYYRVRSDIIYFRTTGTGGIQPVGSKWPKGPAINMPGKPIVTWPSYRVNGYAVTTAGGLTTITVNPNGALYIDKPSIGRVIMLGAWSYPRG